MEVETVVVTARRREEQQQDVPVAVSAFTEQTLDDHAIQSVVDFTATVPNFRVITDPAGSNTASLTLRGQSTNNITVNFDPAVGIYVDEVYLGRATGNVVLSFQDVEGVEVLRGVQGTLFGRNTTGGALVIRTRKPNLDQFEGNLGLGLGTHDQRTFEGVVNVPLLEGKLGLRVSANGLMRDGFLTSATTGIDDFGDRNRKALRVGLRYAPVDDLVFDLAYDTAVSDETGQLQACFSGPPSLGCLPLSAAHTNRSTNGISRPYSRGAVDGYSLNTSWNAPSDIQVKAILAYRRLSTDDVQDTDGGPGVAGDFFLRKYQHQYSGEVNASGSFLESEDGFLRGVDWVAGLFAFKEVGEEERQLPWFSTPATGSQFFVDATNKSQAVYGQLEARLENNLSIYGGVRYTKDKREGRSASVRFGVCAFPPAGTPISGRCRSRNNESFGYWSWQLGLRYRLTDDINTYVRAAHGVRAGGIDNNTLIPFKPEKITEYEAGLKADWLDRRLRTNLALFHSNYKDVQRTSLVPFGNPPVNLSSLSNAAKATLTGFEAEGVAVLGAGFTASGNVGYLHSNYDSYVRRTATLVSDFSGLPFAIKWTYSAALDYRTDLASGTFRGHIDYSWRGKQANIELQTVPPNPSQVSPTGAFAPLTAEATDLPSVGLWNARVSYEMPLSGKFLKSVEFAVYAKNFTNERYNVSGLQFIAPSYTLWRNSEPRVIAAEVKGEF